MSRYTIEVVKQKVVTENGIKIPIGIPKTTIFAYGFDRPLQEYFLDKKVGDSFEPVVGFGEPAEFPYGCNSAMLQGINKYKLQDLIPADHMARISGDLPF